MASFIQERGAVTSFLVRSTPHRAALIRALADGIALCSWAIHFILTVPLFTQVIDQVPVQTVKNLRGLEAIYSIRWKRIHIAIIIILIDSCNGN